MAYALSGCHRPWRVQLLLVVSGVLAIPSASMGGGALDLPVVFIQKQGQSPRDAAFVSRAGAVSGSFRAGRAEFRWRGGRLSVEPVGGRTPSPQGGEPLPGRANFLLGPDPAGWRANVPLYGSIVYRDVYPGIDFHYGSAGGRLKSEYTVAPGGEVSAIRLRYRGVRGVWLDQQGALHLRTGQGEWVEQPPVIYQVKDGRRDPVRGGFRVLGESEVGFRVSPYDRSRMLVIDPILSYGTFLGGAGGDRATAVAVDASGSAYITGYTDSASLATTAGAPQAGSAGGVDAFVLKLSPSGSSIVYWTFLGGAGDDRGFSIAVDSSGYAYVTGYTQSANFPPVSAFRSTLTGSRDAFVSKLNPTGTALVYSTYLGGAASDTGNSIAVAPGNLAVVTGVTASSNFPLANAYQSALSGASDAFVTRLASDGASLTFSSYLGGTGDERGTGVAVDASGYLYVAGTTTSANFPTFSAFQAAIGGGQDIFIAKLNADSAGLLFGSYLGGSSTDFSDVGRSLVLDAAGGMYMAGRTSSANFPVQSAYQSIHKGGGTDCFAAKVNASGTLAFSTYLGGTGADACTGVAVDSTNRVLVAGYTASPDFPNVSPTQAGFGGVYDAFVAKLNSAGSVLMESTFHGGVDSDAAYGIAVDTAGAAYVVGQTLSANLPLLGAAQSVIASSQDGFAARFSFQGPPVNVSVTPSSGTGASQSFALVYSDPLGYGDLGWVEAGFNSSSSKAAACYLRYDAAGNLISLYHDAGTGFGASLAPGAAGTLENSQCVVNAASSSAGGAGNSLTLTLSVNFKAGFAGTKNIYMQSSSRGGDTSALEAKGTWTVPSGNQAPVSLSVSPSSGAASSQTFSFRYSDANGLTDIRWTEMAFGVTLTSVGTCYLHYDRAANTIQLANDGGTDWVGTRTVGVAGTLQSSQCVVDAGASSTSSTTGTLTVNLAIAFRAAFAGTKNIYMQALDVAGLPAGWTQKGTFTVTAANEAPAPVSVSPSSGSGYSASFTFTYSDINGYADIRWTEMAFGASLTPVASCYLHFDRANSTLQLANDGGTDWVATRILGTVATLQNSQCSIDLAASSSSGAGNNVTVTLAVSFKAAFAGAKNVYMQAMDQAGLPAGWFAKGVYTVVASGQEPPVPVSVTPSSGTGSTQTFTFVYSDPAGYTNLRWVEAAVNAVLTSVNSCYIHYDRITNLIQLANNTGTDWVGSAAMGSPGTVQNAQCAVDAAASSASGSGNNFTVNLRITFLAGFSGAKNIFMQALNNAGIAAGWQTKGTWTVP